MIHPIPSGTRDVLPDEMREMRAITEALRGVFERSGYGEVYTPALEYEAVLARAGTTSPAGLPPAYRVFDETRRGAGAALGHDGADRADGGDALRDGGGRRCGSATWRTATAGCARSAGSRASCCRPASSWSGRRRRRARSRRWACCARRSTRRASRTTAWVSATRRCTAR